MRKSPSPLLLACLGCALLAQGTQTAAVSGRVLDAQGRPLAQVAVRLTSPALQGVRVAVTDAAGRFTAPFLPPGEYALQCAAAGFRTVTLRQRLQVGQTLAPRILLPREEGATVTVAADPEPGVAVRMTEDIKPLPAEQNLDDVLQTFTPGVADPGVNSPRVRGAMSTGNLYLVDGQNIQDGFLQASGIPLIEDAIQEVQVLTGAIPAEYGQVEGGVVNAVTQSGGNAFHGYLRFELDNPAWNAVQPLQDRQAIPDHVNNQKSLTLGGPVLTDRLWFFAAAYGVDAGRPGNIQGNALPGAQGAPFTDRNRETRFQGKLTWAVNAANTLVFNLDNSLLDQRNQDPTGTAGTVAALVPVRNTYGFLNLDWRSSLGPETTLELRAGRKFQDLTQGANPGGGTPLLNTTDGLVYGNGLFAFGDGGQHFDSRSLSAKLGLAWGGTHASRAGLDWRQDRHRARADGSPTGQVAQVANLDLQAGTAEGVQLDTYRTYGGQAVTATWGLWGDDRWTVNDRLLLQLGARVDRYRAQREDGTAIAAATAFSPRLGLRYDPTGQGRWALGASYARYQGRVLQTYLDQATHQGAPTLISTAYSGPAGPQPLALLRDPAQYGPTLAGYSDPAVNVRVNPGLKPPSVDEWQLSLTRTFSSALGRGTLSATYVDRRWHDLIDYRIGDGGTVTDPAGQSLYVQVWDNDPGARRVYHGLELAGSWQGGPWTLSGHATWASLRGNYEGEQQGLPGTGEGRSAWAVQDGVAMFNRDAFHPYGYLVGHTPYRGRLFLHRDTRLLGGVTTWGLIYRFVAGQHYDQVRTVAAAAVNPALSPQAGGTFTQVLARGGGVFSAQDYLDVAVTQTWNAGTVAGAPLSWYCKLVATNVLNRIRVVSWNTGYAPGASLAESFAPAGPGFGRPGSAADYGEARALVLHLGAKF